MDTDENAPDCHRLPVLSLRLSRLTCPTQRGLVLVVKRREGGKVALSMFQSKS
jgi:hypothetical protein